MADNLDDDSLRIDLDSLLRSATQSDPEVTNTENESQGLPLEEVKKDYQIKELKQKLKAITQDNKEKRQSHRLRKEHLGFLSKITIYWLGLITVVSFLQGFGGFGLPFFPLRKDIIEALPFYIEYPKFHLTDATFIALVTTTTATILGLYTIAAIWLYKAKKEEAEKNDGNEGKK